MTLPLAPLRFSGIYVVQKVVAKDTIHKTEETFTAQEDALALATMHDLLTIQPSMSSTMGQEFAAVMREQLEAEKSQNFMRNALGVEPETMMVRDFCRSTRALKAEEPGVRYVTANQQKVMGPFSPLGYRLLPESQFNPRHYFDEQVFLADDERGNHATQVKAMVSEFRKHEADVAETYRQRLSLPSDLKLAELVDELYESNEDFTNDVGLAFKQTVDKLKTLFKSAQPAELHITVKQTPEQPPEATYRLEVLA